MQHRHEFSIVAVILVFVAGSIVRSAEASHMYWASSIDGTPDSEILRANLDGSGVTLVTDSANHKVRDVALDLVNGHIYYTNEDVVPAFGHDIVRRDLDGSNPVLLLTGMPDIPEGITLDVPNGHMYWASSIDGTPDSEILRANLDGSGVTLITDSANHKVRDVALDLVNGHIYYTNEDVVPAFGHDIIRRDLDGSNPVLLLTGMPDIPEGIALDVPNGHMYWASSIDGTPDSEILRANLDGSGVTLITDSANHKVRDVALDLVNGHIYYTNEDVVPAFGHDIIRRDLDGSNPVLLLTGMPDIPEGIAIVPEPSSIILAAFGVVALGTWRWRRKR